MGEPGPDLRHVRASRVGSGTDRRHVAQRGSLGSEFGSQSREHVIEFVENIASNLVAHADRLEESNRSARPEQRCRSRPPESRVDPVECCRREDRIERLARKRYVFEPAEVEADEVRGVHPPSRELDHGRSRFHCVDTRSRATSSSVSFPGSGPDLDDTSTRAETRQLDRGTDDLSRIARPTRVVCLGDRIEHAAMPPWLGHDRTLRPRRRPDVCRDLVRSGPVGLAQPSDVQHRTYRRRCRPITHVSSRPRHVPGVARAAWRGAPSAPPLHVQSRQRSPKSSSVGCGESCERKRDRDLQHETSIHALFVTSLVTALHERLVGAG